MEFPWRWQMVTTFGAAVVGALALRGKRPLTFGIVILGVAMLMLDVRLVRAYSRHLPQSLAAAISNHALLAPWQAERTYDPMYLPDGARQVHPGASAASPAAPGNVRVKLAEPGSIDVRSFWFPGWRARDSKGMELPIERNVQDGSIRVSLPAGEQVIRVDFDATEATALGDWISIAALGCLVALAVWSSRRGG